MPRVLYDEVKTQGIHHTPPRLAQFLGSELARAMSEAPSLRASVLDPACGDGELLVAAAERLPAGTRFVGIDQREDVLEIARQRLMSIGVSSEDIELHAGDFLEWVATELDSQHKLTFHDSAACLPLLNRFNAVISNPPYVRTQVLGAKKAQRLARLFDTVDRTDLYHAFIVAITNVLVPGGYMALLCSNRFLTTRSGAGTRALLSRQHRLIKVVDLGDTKFFRAAVLPAIVVSQRSTEGSDSVPFIAIYERDCNSPNNDKLVPLVGNHLLDAAADARAGLVRHHGKDFVVSCGAARGLRDSKRPWTPATPQWMDRIREAAKYELQDIVRVRVGIKTTADSVFIRDDWESLPASIRPENDLLQPLITHHVAYRWAGARPQRRVLYPYHLDEPKRTVLDLGEWPRARAYLQAHRARLESRSYVVASGREWWEIWVPQKPDLWKNPKIVFPDISDTPRFLLDESGALVNGDCYWITFGPQFDEDLRYLILAVANSRLAQRFYDECCGNKLYAGRRRYMTQYVGRIPLPDPATRASRAVVDRTRLLVAKALPGNASQAEVEQELEELVNRAFGLEELTRESDLEF